MADPMAVLVGNHRIAVTGMTQLMAQQRPNVAGLALQIGVQAADGLQDHLHLGQQEIGEVVVVALAIGVHPRGAEAWRGWHPEASASCAHHKRHAYQRPLGLIDPVYLSK